jgi:putative ABC transport system permease protein
MLKNYLKIAWRNLTKNKVYSAINISGLAVGIACCTLIALYVQNEWSFDEFHTKADRTYRTWTNANTEDGREILLTSTPVILGPTMAQNIPEIEHMTYIFQLNNLVNTTDNPESLNESIQIVNEDFFQIFDFQLLDGNAESVFSNPSSVVLSEETATRFFGAENPVQKSLSIRVGDTFKEFIVSGIIQNPPSNSSLSYNILMPYANLKYVISEEGRTNWFNVFGSTFITLREGTVPEQLDDKFASMMQSALGQEVYSQNQYTIGLQPLTDIHLNTDFPLNLAAVSDPAYSYILSAIALLILLVAFVNFMTLSISKSTSRAKEVGIRKTIGALRRHLMYQFWGEALMMTTFAFVIGITLAELLLPFFNELSGTALTIGFTLQTVGLLVFMAILVSLIAGIYPALVLSGFRPIEVLKGRLNVSSNKGRFQQVMVVFQFALSIALIIGTITMQRQLNFVQNKNLGYQKDQVLVVESGFSNGPQTRPDELIQQSMRRKQLLKNEIGSLQEIESISVSSFTPAQAFGWYNLGFTDDQNQNQDFHANFVDADFIPTIGITITQGRNFSDDNPGDLKRAIIVNQALVDDFGWNNPIGQQLPGPEFDDHEVIGVVENFNYQSLHTPVEPLAMAMSAPALFSGIQKIWFDNSPAPRYSLKLTTGNLSGTVAQIEEAWEKIAPGTPFNYTFIDQALDSQYRQERRLSSIVSTGSLLAVIIACLGLFGLASLMVVRRTKEIGVRKVLGASSANIVFLVNKEFTRLVAIAFLIAAPIAWFGMSEWLQDFAYRVDLGWGIFLLAGLIALGVAWLTVSWQSIKATLINPVESLKSE